MQPFKRCFSSSRIQLSFIGKRQIKYPPEVSITVQPLIERHASFPTCTDCVKVVGPKGTLTFPIQPYVTLQFPDAPPELNKQICAVQVQDPEDKKQRAMWGTTRALLNNMVEGVTAGFTVPIRLNGVGYRAQFDETKKKLDLRLGFSHPVLLDIPSDVQVSIPAPQRIILQGIDLHKVSQYAASIRKYRPPEPYNQKGIFVGDETIKKKEGKKR